ncbi:hypothetical protein ABBQ32_008992 [Trebouxia sp. C0010 RCD-2024]
MLSQSTRSIVCKPPTCRDHCYSNRRKPFVPLVTCLPLYAFRSLPVCSSSNRFSRYKILVAAKNSETEPQPAQEEPDMADLTSASKQSLVAGQLCLGGVAILWGSYSPVVRYIYSCPGPPTPAALTAVRTVLQAVALFISDVVLRQQQGGYLQKAKALRGTASPRLSRNYDSYPAPVGSALSWLTNALRSTNSKLWVAGVELGFWNFCGSTFQTLGLQYTSATRGAFLIQATSLLTPVMAALAGEKPSRGVWLGCCCTLAGTVLITLDHSAATITDQGSAAASSLGGDSLILAAAFFYSVVTIRLGGYAKKFVPVRLAASKSFALAIIAVTWLLCTALFDTVNARSTEYWSGWNNPWAVLAVVWSALGPGALVAFLQSQGQAVVSSAQSQVIYSTVPVWSAILAFQFMPEETMGQTGYAGGLLVILAGFLATR